LVDLFFFSRPPTLGNANSLWTLVLVICVFELKSVTCTTVSVKPKSMLCDLHCTDLSWRSVLLLPLILLDSHTELSYRSDWFYVKREAFHLPPTCGVGHLRIPHQCSSSNGVTSKTNIVLSSSVIPKWLEPVCVYSCARYIWYGVLYLWLSIRLSC